MNETYIPETDTVMGWKFVLWEMSVHDEDIRRSLLIPLFFF